MRAELFIAVVALMLHSACGGVDAAQPQHSQAENHGKGDGPEVDAGRPASPTQEETSARKASKTVARITKDLHRDCEAGDGVVCFDLGEMYRKGDSVAIDAAVASGLFEKSCAAEHAKGCLHAAIVHDEGKAVTQDKDRAAKLYGRGCDLGNGRACQNLGLVYYNGEIGKQDPEQANALFERACDKDIANGCLNLAHAYALGEGVVKDSSRADKLYEKACRLGQDKSCNHGVLATKQPPAQIPPTERLSREELLRASEAARSRVPPVDKAAADKCKKLPTQSTAEMATAAQCYRAAGNLGRAIVIWKQVIRDDPNGSASKDALDNLGPAFEKAGQYRDAAEYHYQYASRYPREKDAAARGIRATCTWRQLGDTRSAEKSMATQRHSTRGKPMPPAEELCASLRPITPP